VILREDIKSTRFVVDGADKTLVIKREKAKDMTRRKWILLVRTIIAEAKKYNIKNISIVWKDLVDFENIGEDLGEIFAQNVLMANYTFHNYQKKPKEGWDDVERVTVVAPQSKHRALKKELRKGKVIGTQVNVCRSLANTPGNDMTPKILAAAARKMAKNLPIRVRVLGEKQMRNQKMGGVLAVGRGSRNASQFIIMQYNGSARQHAKPIVLIGKGITFDTGGVDTKPHPYALDMMMDMSGGASVMATIVTAAKLKMKKNIVALIPAAENMPDGASFKPGDIIRMMDGTTVEVGHTDAEGRLVLADAITYAKKYKPKMVIDVATLTGAAVVALGERATAVFTNDEDLAKRTVTVAEETGDYAWRLPLWEEYEAEIKGTFGEISNINTKSSGGYGGAITAATFLKHFACEHPSWMHLDIAPTMTSVFDERLAKGAKGSPVRLLVKVLENY